MDNNKLIYISYQPFVISQDHIKRCQAVQRLFAPHDTTIVGFRRHAEEHRVDDTSCR